MAVNRRSNRGSLKAGLAPGTLVYVGEKRAEEVVITVMDYNEGGFVERQVERVEDCFGYKDTDTVTWINVDGLSDVGLIEKLGGHFGIHHLVLEDILHTAQRPKMEDYEKHIYVVIRMLTWHEEERAVGSEQVSLVLGDNFVISFQETVVGDVFDNVRDRIRTGKGRVRKMGADYLAYSLMDAIVDNYFLILEKIGEEVEEIEEEIFEEATEETLWTIQGIKKELLFLRKSVWPLREVVNNLGKVGSGLIREGTGFYLRDLYDHTIGIMDTVESLRDTAGGMMDIYLSSLSNRMNSVMKVLTVISTIFIPLTFIVGVYGMNFEHMPELEWRLGYPAVLLVMLVISGCMLMFFKRKDWF